MKGCFTNPEWGKIVITVIKIIKTWKQEHTVFTHTVYAGRQDAELVPIKMIYSMYEVGCFYIMKYIYIQTMNQ